MPKKTFEERAKDLKTKLAGCVEKIESLEAEIAAKKRDGAMPPKGAEEKLKTLIGQRKLILSQMSKLRRAQDSHSKYVLGGIMKNHLEDHAGEPLSAEKILEALLRDTRAARNHDLVGLAILLHGKVYPGASLEEVNRWAAGSKDFLWARPRVETKKQEPRPVASAQQSVKPSEPEAAAAVPPENPIEPAQKDPVERPEIIARLKEEWNRAFASNERVLSLEMSYWRSEMGRETGMFEHTLKYLDAEEAKLREDQRAQKGVFKKARREQIEEQIRDLYRQRSLCIQQHERNLASFKEETSPERVLQKVFSDTKGQRPELLAQMDALGIAPD